MEQLLNKLLPPVSVSGCEGAVSAVLRELGKPYGEVVDDALGNLVIHRPGNGKRIMLAAHMDSIGVIVTYVDDKGFARFGRLGGMKIVPMVGQRVKFENGVIGVICAEADVEPKDLDENKMYIDTAGEKVEIGDTAAFCAEPYYVNGKVISPALDNRLGCAICLRALELLEKTDNDIFCTFTVQEEVGRRGARPAAYTIMPDLGIAIDIHGVFDYPGGKSNGMTLSGGPVVKLLDQRTISHPTVVKLLEDTAKELGIKTQRCVTKKGGTDASMIAPSRGGVPAATLSVPIRYTHTANEVADLAVAEQCAKLLAAAIAK